MKATIAISMSTIYIAIALVAIVCYLLLGEWRTAMWAFSGATWAAAALTSRWWTLYTNHKCSGSN